MTSRPEAVGGAWRAGDGQRAGAPAELAVEDQERQPAEVVAVQVGDEHGADLAGVEAAGPERAERCRPAVEQDGCLARRAQVDAGLVTPAAAEGIAGAGERHGDARLRRGLAHGPGLYGREADGAILRSW
jgi:hypothetical protein